MRNPRVVVTNVTCGRSGVDMTAFCSPRPAENQVLVGSCQRALAAESRRGTEGDNLARLIL